MTQPLTHPQDEIEITLRKAVQSVEHANIDYCITDGLASIAYGEPRLTSDIDIVISAEQIEGKIHPLVERLRENEFIVYDTAVQEALQYRTLFQAIYQPFFLKIDFHFCRSNTDELARAREMELYPGIRIRIISPEDAIISKLIWIRKGSSRSRQDVVGVLRRQKDRLDFDYINQICEKLKVSELFDELQKIAVDLSKSVF